MRRITQITSIVIFLNLFLGCGKKDLRKDYFTIANVLSGNQLKLRNGFEVILIGIENNPATYEFLKQYENNGKVRFVFDQQSPRQIFSPKSKIKLVHAYVVDSDGVCLNSEMLRKNLTRIPLPQPFLTDSLNIYYSYLHQTPGKKNESSANQSIPEEETVETNNVDKFLKDLIAASDFMNPTTRDYAVKIAGRHSGSFNINQACGIFTELMTNWNYVNDPRGSEFFSTASNTIDRANLSGDCDDFAILMYSLLMAIGGRARIVFAIGEQSGHAFVELDISQFGVEKTHSFIRDFFRNDFPVQNIHFYKERDGSEWLNMDYWAMHPGGPYISYSERITFYPSEKRVEFH